MKKDFEQAIDWEASTTRAYRLSEARAWKIAAAAVIVALLSLGGLVFMLPFYKVVPMTFLVDKATGEAQLVDAASPIPVTNAQTDKHWINEYVNSRERYNWMLLQYDYDHTLSLSDDSAAREFKGKFEGENGLDKQLGNFTERRIKIVSTTLPPGAPGTAIVRFERTTRERGYDIEIGAKFIATITYKYSKPSTLVPEKYLVMNPMGFKVTGYVVDKEEKSAPIQSPAAALYPEVSAEGQTKFTSSPEQ